MARPRPLPLPVINQTFDIVITSISRVSNLATLTMGINHDPKRRTIGRWCDRYQRMGSAQVPAALERRKRSSRLLRVRRLRCGGVRLVARNDERKGGARAIVVGGPQTSAMGFKDGAA